MTESIAIKAVRKAYGKNEVVHGVDLEISAGEFVVVLGPSGCGKSTLLRMIAGLEDITSGTISIGGTVVNDLEPRGRGCAMVFQNYALYPHMSVADNIGYALKVAGMKRDERTRKIREVAKMLAIEDYLDRKPAQLSGGQRQRVAMGRAMIREPKVFLFDEPLSNLDAKLRVQMRIEIRRLHNRLKATSVFVTHDQIEAMTLADRLVVMNAGRVEQVGAPGDVYRQPASRFVASFIGSPPMNLIEGKVVAGNAVDMAGHIIEVAGGGLDIGRRVTVGIRSEDVVVGTSGPSPMEIPVDFVEELGAARLLHGRLGPHDFVVQTPATADAPTPTKVEFAVPPGAVHLFDAETGQRVGAAADRLTVAA